MSRLALRQLDKKLINLKKSIGYQGFPRMLSLIRQSVGMTAEQMARRCGISRRAIQKFEKAEETGGITLKTLARLADRLDCDVYHIIVPRESLEAFVKERAHEVALKKLEEVQHTMGLEDQGLENEEFELQIKEYAEELLAGNLKKLWDD